MKKTKPGNGIRNLAMFVLWFSGLYSGILIYFIIQMWGLLIWAVNTPNEQFTAKVGFLVTILLLLSLIISIVFSYLIIRMIHISTCILNNKEKK